MNTQRHNLPQPSRLTFLSRPQFLLPLLAFIALLFVSTARLNAAEGFVLQTLHQHCGKCHGKAEDVEADVDLMQFREQGALLAKPDLLHDILEAVDTAYMPPEDEPELPAATRTRLVKELKSLVQQATSSKTSRPPGLRRMNRFQYNNAVQDLFQLRVEVFSLPERMMREHRGYFQPASGKMPPQVTVGSRPLGKSQLIEPRLAGVAAFPQDLRAEHGFDNRDDHLSLSPLLLEAFLTLGQSVVNSPDFNPRTCGVWPQLFATPSSGEDAGAEIRKRLATLLRRAFRQNVGQQTVDRYAAFVEAEIKGGQNFTDAMKAAAAAVIASPRFFYLYEQLSPGEQQETAASSDFNLASRLSFFLWGSLPDEELLRLAAGGTLQQPEVLTAQVNRMLRDRRLKRFCDSFPAQWLQLERIVSSTPDDKRFPQFYFLKYRASMHMMLEPLLLFESVLIENDSVLQLLDSNYSYRSELLEEWYKSGRRGRPGSPVTVQFKRVPINNRREGGVITTAATMTMLSGPDRTQPITRGAWVANVILHDPPEPPPADVPPLAEKPPAEERDLTLRERLAAHRKRASCKGCHQKIDPLGFALENYNAAGIWREKYGNGRDVDASGVLFGKHPFKDVVEFKDALLAEKQRFLRAFASHLLSFALGREIDVQDTAAIDQITQNTASNGYKIHTLIQQIALSEPFRRPDAAATTASMPKPSTRKE